MPIPKRFHWWPLVIAAAIFMVIWFKFNYPQLSFVNFSISRNDAVDIAKKFLTSQNIAVSDHKCAVAFSKESSADRYLQKTIGFEAFKSFVLHNDFDLFFWLVRFFKEGEEEEFRVSISAKSGQVTGYSYFLDSRKKIPDTSKDEAYKKAVSFFKKQYAFEPLDYRLQLDTTNKQDNLTEYKFGWEKNNVRIPWSQEPDAGYGKLTRYIGMAGDTILTFSKYAFSVPAQFQRHLTKYSVIENNILSVTKIFYFILLAGSVFLVVRCRNHLAMHSTKKFYIQIALIFIGLSILSIANNFQGILFNYKTTGSFESYFFQYLIDALMSIILMSMLLVIPSLAGELAHYETMKEKKTGSFLYYLHTTFFSRDVTKQICIGYFAWFILLGMQSLLFEIGERYWGVWVEYSWMGQISTAYLPFIAALVVGIKAGFGEEIMYRMFAISWGKKIFKNTLIACIAASLIWGFAHSNYPVFPKWFRGIEVSCLGLFLSFIYLRYGIIAVIVAHYLFDAFWSSSSYILGEVKPFDFYTSLLVILLPLIYAISAYFINKPVHERNMSWVLNKQQQFNAGVLDNYIKMHPELIRTRTQEELVKEISHNGWDPAVVETVCEKFYNSPA